jgi:hypothetical protein
MPLPNIAFERDALKAARPSTLFVMRNSQLRYLVGAALLLVADATAADELRKGIERQAAEICGCSRSEPCLIEILERDQSYSVGVLKIVAIDEGGIASVLPSKTYIIFDSTGRFVKKVGTP